MAQIVLSLLLLSLTTFGFSDTVDSTSSARAYLEAQCRTSIYPDLCVETLLPYVSKTILAPHQLAQVSLIMCLSKARQTKDYVNILKNRLNESDLAIEECLRHINDGVDQITLSVKEFQRMGKDDEETFVLHEGNVQSWVSASLTDVDMCIDGLLGDGIKGREKAIIKAKFLNVKQLASNSLSLFNRFASRHRASHIVKNP